MPVRNDEGTNETKPQERHPTPEPVELLLKPSGYQPSKAEMEEEFDTSGLSLDEIRTVSFRPFAIRREDSA